MARTGQFWRWEPGVSLGHPHGYRNPHIWAILHDFPGTLTGSSQVSNWHPYGCQHHRQRLNWLHHDSTSSLLLNQTMTGGKSSLPDHRRLTVEVGPVSPEETFLSKRTVILVRTMREREFSSGHLTVLFMASWHTWIFRDVIISDFAFAFWCSYWLLYPFLFLASNEWL